MMLTSSSSSDSDEEYPAVIVRRRRIFRRRINFTFDVTDFTFNEKFRVTKTTAEYLINAMSNELAHGSNRNAALTPAEQILCALHWMGSGSQYHIIADTHGISKATVHNCLKRVATSIVNTLFGDEVRWPENCREISRLFMTHNIPRIAGILDGSLIQMDAPQQNEPAFVDRDGNHSTNVMVVCGPNLDFFYASARWPGSVHDARVMRCSSLAQEWQAGWRPFPNAIILADSGYGLTPWLMTPRIPIQIPRTLALERYLRAFRSTRRMVENALGILKEKFPCLNYLRVQPTVASKIILSCITLHNIEKRLGSAHYHSYLGQQNNEPNEHDNLQEANGGDAEEEFEQEAIDVLQSLIQRFQ